MKKIVMLLILFYLTQIISAQSINVDYLDKVNSGKEFFVEVELVGFDPGIYDVKIDILGNGNRIAKILNEGNWKSTYYYVNEAVKENKGKFNLIVEDYVGSADIEIKIRKTGSSSAKTFGGYSIEFVENENSNDETNSSNEKYDLEENKIEKKNIIPEVIENDENYESVKNTENEIIQLSQNIKRVDGENKEGKKRIYAVYGFVLFSILILLLFVLKFITSKMPRGKNGIA